MAGSFLILFGREIAMILAKSTFYDALDAIPPVVMGYIFYSLYNMYSRNLEFAKKTIYSSIIVLIAGVVNILLNALFIPTYGILAAAYNTTASYALMSILGWIVSKFIIRSHSIALKKVLIDYILFSIVIVLFYVFQNISIPFIGFIFIKLGLFLTLSILIMAKYIYPFFLKKS